MQHQKNFYIDGAWVDPLSAAELNVVDPSSEQAFARIAMGGQADVDRAVAAARCAFPSFSATPMETRIALLRRIRDIYKSRAEKLAQAVSREMGAPISIARSAHVTAGLSHLTEILTVLERFKFERLLGTTLIVKEAIGVCAMITPWNWPLNQMMCKIAPAIAAGCTMVVKPSELAATSGLLVAEIMDEAGAPKGVFNLVNGDGPGVGAALASHPDVDMVSFTGSTRAGVLVSKAAADTIKRVTLELGGKSANILLPDVDIERAVSQGVARCFLNSGQSCNAPTRMLVPHDKLDEVIDLARSAAEKAKVGDPSSPETTIGPLANKPQFDKVQSMIEAGIDEGARVVCGGPGRPHGLNNGYYAKPTVFVATPEMQIAREEVFGPVLTVLAYEDEEDAVRIAEDSLYGLAGYVSSADPERARRLARRLRAGTIHINYPVRDPGAPFGGYKRSGLGREWGEFGLEDFLEIKGLVGYGAS
jgi:aldehyde dehydrogenase (NAD+)